MTDWRDKAFCLLETDPIGAHALDDLLLPALVLHRPALERNIALMADWCRLHDVSLAPHAKTTMTPAIFRRELAAGAWGLTAQTIAQARVLYELGVRRILLANQIMQRAAVDWLDRTPDLRLTSLVDSPGVLSVLTSEREQALEVLVELGVRGGRTGCRTTDQAHALARDVLAAPGVALAGVEAFDGLMQGREDAINQVDDLVTRLRSLVEELDAAGAFAGRDEIIVSAGTSAFFDVAAARLASGWTTSVPVRVVLRCGAYATHDALYHDISPLDGRASERGHFVPALEAWALITSTPEPGLAIAAMGKRDVSFDTALPVPIKIRGLDGTMRTADGIVIDQLMDHHAFVRGDGLLVGEAIGCSISHTCTAFDKWRAVPMVDESYRVVEVAETYY